MFKTLELPGGFAPLDPLPGLCPGPTGGLKRPQTPRPIILHPPFLIPGYGPELLTIMLKVPYSYCTKALYLCNFFVGMNLTWK